MRGRSASLRHVAAVEHDHELLVTSPKMIPTRLAGCSQFGGVFKIEVPKNIGPGIN